VMKFVRFVVKVVKPKEAKTEHPGAESIRIFIEVRETIVRSVPVRTSRWCLHDIPFGVHALGVGCIIAGLRIT
jgi:hypothetical protein